MKVYEFLRSKFLIFFIILSGCSPDRTYQLDSWSVFNGNNQHTGVYDVKPIKNNVKVKWAFKTGGPIRGSAVIRRNILYFGSGDGFLYALAEETGNELWRFKTGGAVQSTPLVTDNLLVFSSRDKYIYALNPSDGTEFWKIETGAILPLEWEFDYYLSSPILAENTIYIGAGDGFLYAINPADGEVKWKTQTEGRIRTAPAYSDGLVYVGNMSGRFIALNAGSGEIVWDFTVEGLKSDFEEYGFDRASILGAAAIKGGTVIFGSRDAFVYALDKNTGEEKWKITQENTSWAITSPAVIDTIVYAGTSDARFIHALHLETGKEIWRTENVGANWPSPVIAEDVLYSGNYRDEIFALDRFTGEKLWVFRTGHANLATGVPKNEMLYTGSDDGYFYALSGSSQAGNDQDEVFKAVHWELRNARILHDSIKNKLVKHGYELLDSISIVSFMEDRINDNKRSVAVMAVNLMPGALLSRDGNQVPLLRKYLNAGGKIVWLGTRHFLRTRDRKVLQAYDNITKEVLEIDYQNDLRGLKGFVAARPTPAGYAWGLRTEFWIGCCGVDPDQVTTVLAYDEYGRAAAWIKNFSGQPGSGFVRLEVRDGLIHNIKVVTDIAEYGF